MLQIAGDFYLFIFYYLTYNAYTEQIISILFIRSFVVVVFYVLEIPHPTLVLFLCYTHGVPLDSPQKPCFLSLLSLLVSPGLFVCLPSITMVQKNRHVTSRPKHFSRTPTALFKPRLRFAFFANRFFKHLPYALLGYERGTFLLALVEVLCSPLFRSGFSVRPEPKQTLSGSHLWVHFCFSLAINYL